MIDECWTVDQLIDECWTVDQLIDECWTVDQLTDEYWTVDQLIDEYWTVDQLIDECWTVDQLPNEYWTVDQLTDGFLIFFKIIPERSLLVGQCGDYMIQDGEECDAGALGMVDSDPCCTSDCRLRDTAPGGDPVECRYIHDNEIIRTTFSLIRTPF